MADNSRVASRYPPTLHPWNNLPATVIIVFSCLLPA